MPADLKPLLLPDRLELPVRPLALLRMFVPLVPLLALSLWLRWDQWTAKPWLLGVVLGSPLALLGLVFALRDRWRLVLTREALEHHTFTRVERFPWQRMGQVEGSFGGPKSLAPTVRFAFPTDAPGSVTEQVSKRTGRQLLDVFGPANTSLAGLLQEWRAKHGNPDGYLPPESTRQQPPQTH